MNKKILLLCKVNLNRSKIGEVIFNEQLRRINLDSICSVSSAGVAEIDSTVPHFVNSALKRAGYGPVINDRPSVVRTDDLRSADLIFTMSDSIFLESVRPYKNFPEVQEMVKNKTKLLPEYGLSPSTEGKDEIFDPASRLVSPRDSNSGFYSTLLEKLPSTFTEYFVIASSLGRYIPNTADRKFTKQIDRLYDRTVRQLETCITTSITKMKKEGFFRK